MESVLDYTTRNEDTDLSMLKALKKTKEVTGEYHDAAEIAEQLSDGVTEKNEDATYDEVFDIEPDSFEALDEVGGQKGLINKYQMDKVASGEAMRNDIPLLPEPGYAIYNAQSGGSDAARLAISDSRDPEKEFSLESKQEVQRFAESFYGSVERRTGSQTLADEAFESLESTLENKGYTFP